MLLPIWGFFAGFWLGAQTITWVLGEGFLATTTGWVVGGPEGAGGAIGAEEFLKPDEAFRVIPRDELYMATGIQFLSINTIFQMLSEVKANDPILAGADKFLMMPDLFNHFLCGVDVCEYTEATTGQTLDPWTKDWARPLLDRLGIPTHFLPEIVAPGTVLGQLRNDVADDTRSTGAQVLSVGLAYLAGGAAYCLTASALGLLSLPSRIASLRAIERWYFSTASGMRFAM